MIKRVEIKIYLPWLLALSLQVPALRRLAKYLPSPMFSVPLIFTLMICLTWYGYKQLDKPRSQLILISPWPSLVFVFLLSIAAFFIYPFADELKTIGRGSDADDAMMR